MSAERTIGTTGAEPRQRRRPMDPRNTRSFPLWFGLLEPPAALGVFIVLGDLIFELGCAPGMRTPEILGQSLVFWGVLMTATLAAVTALAGLLAFRAWRELRRQQNGTSLGRATAMAVAGVGSSLLYLLILLFGLLPPLFLHVCTPSQ